MLLLRRWRWRGMRHWCRRRRRDAWRRRWWWRRRRHAGRWRGRHGGRWRRRGRKTALFVLAVLHLRPGVVIHRRANLVSAIGLHGSRRREIAKRPARPLRRALYIRRTLLLHRLRRGCGLERLRAIGTTLRPVRRKAVLRGTPAALSLWRRTVISRPLRPRQAAVL
jgi:hypothetical protein